MEEKRKKAVQTEEKVVLNDYEFSPVPDAKKHTWRVQVFVWLGVGFCLTAFTLGGQIALGLGFWPTVAAVLIGGVILTVVGCFVGVIGVRSGLSSTVSSRFTFGTYGAIIFGLINAFCNFGWFGYQCTFFGSSVTSMFRLAAGIEVNMTVCIVVGGLLMMITAIIGYKGIQTLSKFGVPLLFLLIIFGVVKTFTIVPPGEVFSAPPVAPISFASAISLMVGSFIVGVSIVQDFTRYSKTAKDSTVGIILGFTIGYPAVVICGAIFTCAFQTNDLTDVLINVLGFSYVAAFIIVVATWTTNHNNIYQSVLGLTNACHGIVKLPRWITTAICGIIATVLGAIGMIDWLVPFLNILSVVVPPITGAMLADFYLLKNADNYKFERMNQIPKARLDTSVGAIVGCLVGFCMNEPPVGFGIPVLVKLSTVIPTPLVAMACSIAVVLIINKLQGQRKPHAA